MDAKELILGAKRPLILSHYQADGDAVGSMLGLAHSLRAAGKSPVLALPDPIIESLGFLPGVQEIRTSLMGLPSDVDLIVVLDCGSLDRLEQLYTEHLSLFNRLPIVNIDHHQSNRYFGAANWVGTHWAAVSEEVYFLIKDWGLPLPQPAAVCLLAGVIADSQSFRTPSTTGRTLEAAAGLVKDGAPITTISACLHRTNTPASLRLWGLALSTMQASDGLVWASVSQSMLVTCSSTPAEADGLIDLLCTVRDAVGVLLFREAGDGSVRVSLRSMDDRLDVAEVAGHFGGGGHARASGCHLNHGLMEAENQVLTHVREILYRGAGRR